MKNLLFAIAILLCLEASAQGIEVDTTEFYIRYRKDIMTDKELFIASQYLLCANEAQDKGFIIMPSFGLNKKGNVIYNGLFVRSVGVGKGCIEGGELIFLFADDTRVTAKAYTKFNCDGEAFFDLTPPHNLLSKLQKPIKAVRFTDPRSMDNYTHEVPEENRDFFLSVQAALDNNFILMEK